MALTDGQVALALRLIGDPSETIDASIQPIIERQRLAAKELVTRYAAGAPLRVREEACLRVVGYLFDRPPEYSSRGYSALFHSGAQALLMPWREPGEPTG